MNSPGPKGALPLRQKLQHAKQRFALQTLIDTIKEEEDRKRDDDRAVRSS